MKKYFEQLKKIQNSSMLFQTANDLKRKKLLPDYAMSYLSDPQMLYAAFTEYNKSGIKSWRCPECGITINGAKSWLIQHVKTHHNKKEKKDNEITDTRVNPYWYANRIKI